MRRLPFLLPFFLLSVTPLFAGASWEPIREKILEADISAPGRKVKLQLVKEAIRLADDCIAKNPQATPCYYYRAQATGLYYETVVFGYQKGVRSMIEDWQKSAELDPRFDQGGPYRMLGELYSSLPKYFGTKDLRQDLNKAEGYLQKSIGISPGYPTQHLDLAEVYIKLKKVEAAAEALKAAQTLLPKWTADPYYPDWQKTIKELGEQLDKLKQK